MHATALARSDARFPDGAQMRVEIPSVENPTAMAAVIAAADAHAITVHRVSQGSGAMLLSESELREMSTMGADRGIEVSLFIGPREEFGVGGSVRSLEGRALSGHLRGLHQLRYALEDVLRALECGIRGFLIADPGLMEVLAAMIGRGELPGDIVFKSSAVLAPSNPVSFRQLAQLGMTTINIPSDVTLEEIAEMRALDATPIDLYMEAPDSLGGMVRGHELSEIALVAAPLYAKYGLRNARAVYPAGHQVMADVVENVREKVRRAAISLEWLARGSEEVTISEAGAKGIGVPVR
ncbi:MAG: hypothetical protein KGL23_02570 [Acidobacteriota bacterium]|nr:hypothetical protein [Acidobacteriota bacterium]MDE3092498.1 hypothetical protein [Acidobacteriota bacterium]MDE3138968.1 hypothetical protein [Acidobacteriota bacterium]MDE3146301.1 hypothetical protein [Acidobacteriota bacterium]